ncbi:unnamed protein product [Bursaphelenchus xylophilus]|uniref:(pine wood nematode) hypothetical protein n=1 Tax=Bursaphelenchus xylophilus TaxID=6326 RepID=A0A7I8WXM4_BURXY|nr:unnamed protein product [Bursaphelenchus xylophilus]CAG9100431.1 unnamed protein product [Bursaphelenchus xylophilus]
MKLFVESFCLPFADDEISMEKSLRTLEQRTVQPLRNEGYFGRKDRKYNTSCLWVAPIRRSYYGHDPFHELDRVMGTVLDTIQPALNEAGRLIPANVAGSSLTYSKEGDLTFACDTQGFKPDELKVDIQGQTLLVSGKHQEEKEGEKLERHFQRAIRLPKHVDLAQIKSELDEQARPEADQHPNPGEEGCRGQKINEPFMDQSSAGSLISLNLR